MGVCYRHVVCSFNCYNFENIKIHGQMMITNTPSNTAFRGFGAPQGENYDQSDYTEVN